ncbi:MAG: (d)CMP kinase [Candidatus Binataceae bacterium]
MIPSTLTRSARPQPIIAIDGPTGAGKSTVARELARRLGFTYLNTGAMYRAVAIAARRSAIDPAAPDAAAKLAPLLASITIELEGDRVLLNHGDVTGELALPAISDLASRLSALPAVRARMRELQQATGMRGAIVVEGRDIGTVIFPDAEFKFFLSADLRTRAERRYHELIQKGVSTTFEEVLGAIEERDQRDQQRELAPLKPAADAIVIDSTNYNADEVAARLKAYVGASAPHGRA